MEAKVQQIASLKQVRKLGFITPSSNTALEPITLDMACQIGDRVSAHFSRVAVKTLTLDSQDVDQFQTQKILNTALLLQDGGLDAILWNGTSGSWTGQGLEADRALCQAITESTEVPASTSSLALIEVLKQNSIRRIGLAVPYVDAPTRQIVETYVKEGFTVVQAAQLNESANLDSSLNQMSLATVQWLQRYHELLIQNDCGHAEVKPPEALMGAYGVKAQMLCPLIARERLRGWISVHDVANTHEWAEPEIAALRHAGDGIQSLLEKSGWLM